MNDFDRKHAWLRGNEKRWAELAKLGYSNLDSFHAINRVLRANGIDITGMSDQEKLNIYEGKV